ncbi:MAG TPA: PaaI family thioesterase [Candidatus Eremiobacteraceae bacterium]|nr:PaaI family thioesterase [Candidatus Eremiobacteraceae bacterium]
MTDRDDVGRKAASSDKLVDDRRCFACGPENTDGLQLRFEYCDGIARAVFTPKQHFTGWTAMLHGGILATLLDEAMAHAAIAAGIRALTGRLEIRFRKQAPIDAVFVVEGRLEGRRGRLLTLSSTVAGEDGTLYAAANGRFVADDARQR